MDQVRQIADEIEQYMYERGEYEYRGEDRIRWLSEDNSRTVTTRNLCYAIITNANSLFDYLKSEMAAACKEDADKAAELAQKLMLVAVIVKEDK